MVLPISAVVVNFNGRDYLESCLTALAREEPAEILVVDSGSTDGSPAIVDRFPGARCIELGANLGPAAARNRGMREAEHDLVLLLDNDVELLDGCLRRLHEHIESRRQLALVQARSLLNDADGHELVHYDGGSFHYLGLVSLRNWYVPVGEANGRGLALTDVAISLCCLARRDELVRVGGFDKAMFILFEDLAISHALKLAGYEVGVAEDALCLHKGGTKGLSVRGEIKGYSPHRSFLHSRNRWLFVTAQYEWRSLLLLAPGFLVYGLVHLAFVIVSGHLLAWIRGKWAFVRLLGHVRERRRIVARVRVRGDRQLLGSPPLSFNPGLASSGLKRFVERALGLTVDAWFALVRPLLRRGKVV